ncbi:hypothetical protein TSMEX_005845 [Taenia solium]|eukprot:TsM_000895300 transcript=TsM_000895300 gene=TsM_000895300
MVTVVTICPRLRSVHRQQQRAEAYATPRVRVHVRSRKTQYPDSSSPLANERPTNVHSICRALQPLAHAQTNQRARDGGRIRAHVGK